MPRAISPWFGEAMRLAGRRRRPAGASENPGGPPQAAGGTQALPGQIRFPFQPLARLPGPWAVRSLVFVVFGMAGTLRAYPTGEPAPLRFGFSAEAFVEVKEADARAALKVWAQTLGTERGIPVDEALEIYPDTEAIKDALVNRKIDAVTMMAAQYWALRRVVPLGPFILGLTHGGVTEEYVLLVRRDNPATRLADLRGQSLNIQTGSRASLAAVWMETLLLEAGLGKADPFWGKTTPAGKLTRVILPVFFHQVAACLVTRDGFRTMSELNPQVGRQLKVLARSPAFVPTVFCFRGDLVSPYRDRLLTEIKRVTDSPAGRQTLTLFQSEQLVERPASDLDAACALLDRHERLLAAADAAIARQKTSRPGPPAGGESRP